jgi:hypothetical protein
MAQLAISASGKYSPFFNHDENIKKRAEADLDRKQCQTLCLSTSTHAKIGIDIDENKLRL